MKYKGKILFTRWGGMVQLSHKEVSSANSATLDFYLVRTLIEMGYQICVANASKTFSTLVKEREQNWYEHIVILDVPPVTSEDYNYVFCLQGTENFRFGGCLGIPSQVWVYRLLRDCECPFIYVQYDANTPIFLPPILRGEVCELFGVTTKELFSKNINVAMVGRNTEPLREDFGYPYLYDHIKFHTWDHDFHAIAAPMVEELSLPPKVDPNPTIAFIGKDRRFGSKGQTLKTVAETLSEELPDYYVDVYGDWKKWQEHKENKDIPNIKFNGKVKGLDKVLGIYNNSEFAILVCNDYNLLLEQYTIRTYEVIAGGSIPITDVRWFNQWGDIFAEPVRSQLKELCYETPEQIPRIMRKASYMTSETRIDFINKIRKSMSSVLNKAYVRRELAKMLNESEVNKRNWSPEQQETFAKEVSEKLRDKDLASKFRKKRELAHPNHERRLKVYKDPLGISNEIEEKILSEDYAFGSSALSMEVRKKLFGR